MSRAGAAAFTAAVSSSPDVRVSEKTHRMTPAQCTTQRTESAAKVPEGSASRAATKASTAAPSRKSTPNATGLVFFFFFFSFSCTARSSASASSAMRALVTSASSSVAQTTATRAPSACRRFAVARPMPLPAPVTMATGGVSSSPSHHAGSASGARASPGRRRARRQTNARHVLSTSARNHAASRARLAGAHIMATPTRPAASRAAD